MARQSKSFTLTASKGLLRVLKTHCDVCKAHRPNNNIPHPKLERFHGIWDTGASGTVISENVVKKLSLKPIRKQKVYTASGEDIVNVYAINLFLPNGVGFSFVTVTEGKLHGADLLIGMDIISQGDFSISNQNGNTIFSYRHPSQHSLDFVKLEKNKKKAQPVRSTKKIGRNDPCPCGSDKKFKQCCIGNGKYD